MDRSNDFNFNIGFLKDCINLDPLILQANQLVNPKVNYSGAYTSLISAH